MKPTYSLTLHPLVAHDMDGILTYLQSHSGTASEMAYALRLTVNRVNGLLHELRTQGLVQVDHCKTYRSGKTVNVWAIREPESTVEQPDSCGPG